MSTLAIFVLACAFTVISAGIVDPVEICGGDGIPLEVRVTDCEGEPPCTIVVGRSYFVEGDFIASATSPSLSIKMSVLYNEIEWVELDAEIPNSAVEAGLGYTMGYPFEAEAGSAGFLLDLKFEVYRTGGSLVEICFKAPANILAASR